MEVVASLSQGRTAAAQCGLFTHKSVPVIFEPPCIFHVCYFMFCIPYCPLCSLIAYTYLLLQLSQITYFKCDIVFVIVIHTDECINQKL